MIGSHDEFEATLEEASRLLELSPRDGTPEHERLLRLMQEIASYRPTVDPALAKENSESARLSRRLDEFEARLKPHFTPHWHAMLGGDVSANRDRTG